MSSSLYFAFKKLVSSLILPPGGPLLLALLGLLLWRKWPRIGKTLLIGGLSLGLLLCLPVCSDFLLRQAAGQAPASPNLEQLQTAQAIVILGGGKRFAPEYDDWSVNALTLERVRHGAIIARATQLPVLVTGGQIGRGPSEAKVMQQSLENEFGVPVQWAEDRSHDTHENATLSAPLLKQANVKRIVLVTHAFHMRRAMAEFANVGFEMVPAPLDMQYPEPEPLEVNDFLPSMNALHNSYYALHEMLGYAVVRVDTR